MDVSEPGAAKRKQITRTLNTLSDARKWVESARAERGAHTGAAEETVTQLAERWLASRVDVREVTRQGYRNVLASAQAHIGSQPVAAITVSDIEALTDALTREGGKHGHGLSLDPWSGCVTASGLLRLD